jgi:hypothetical protein
MQEECSRSNIEDLMGKNNLFKKSIAITLDMGTPPTPF